MQKHIAGAIIKYSDLRERNVIEMPRMAADICEGPLLRRMLSYTVPIILTGILQLLFNAADLVVVGQFGSEFSVAAVGATGALINLITNLFIGLSVGAGVSVAQGIGSGSQEDVSRTIHTAMPTAFAGGILLTGVGVFGSRFFLSCMDTPDNVIDLAAIYMQIYFCGILASMVYNFGAAILRAAGETKGPLYYLTAAGAVNVVLNLVFVCLFKMDVAGVALASAISQGVAAALVLLALMRREDVCRFSFCEMHIYGAQLWKIVRIGLPAGIQGSLFSISNVLIQAAVNGFGDVVVTGNSSAANLEGFVYTTMNSFHQTALNFTGQNYGGGRFDRIRRIAHISLLSVMAAGLFSGVLVFLFADPLLHIYIPHSQEAIHYGVVRIAYICLPYFLCGLMDVSTGLIRGLGSSVAPMFITVMGVCVFRVIWICTVFRSIHTLECLYSSYAISWAMTFGVQMLVFYLLLHYKEKRWKSVMPMP